MIVEAVDVVKEVDTVVSVTAVLLVTVFTRLIVVGSPVLVTVN